MALFSRRSSPTHKHSPQTPHSPTAPASAPTFKPLHEYEDITIMSTKKNTRSKVAGVVFGALALTAMTTLLAASSVSTGPNEVAIHIGGGPIEDAAIKTCVPSETKQVFNSPGDEYVRYSTSQRDWDATGQPGSDMGAYHAVSKDNVEMQVPIIVRFYQLTDCETLKAFYKNLGQRYGASINEDGSGNEGWQIMIRKIVADPVDVELGRIVQKYDWTDVRNDPKVRTEIADTLRDEITGLVDSNAQGHYFEHFSVLVKKPEPTDPELKAEINNAQKAKYAAEAAKVTAKAARLQAIAEQKSAQAQAGKLQRQIAGYRLPGMTAADAVRAYNEAKLIDNGGNPFQPQYVVGGTMPGGTTAPTQPGTAPAPVQ